MLKRTIAGIIALLMIFAVGCSNDVVYDDLSDYESSQPVIQEEKPDLTVNPLTGVAEFEDASKANQRPVAIMVNNYNENGNYSVQRVQSGLSKADIIYETETEGSITRLMAVYQDVTEAEKVGTIRSARYQYVDLALGHNAIYIHCGVNKYCTSHLNDVDDLDIAHGKFGGEKIGNGLATEHTLYAWTDKLWNSINDSFNTKTKNATNWVNFTDEALTLDGGAATSVSVPFPTQTTRFTYDGATGLYTRLLGSSVQTDYFTKETTQVKNVFILLTSMSKYDDNKTRKVDLQSGDGYYITNGTVQFIKWKKGASTNGFKFTDTQGNEIKVSAGNSWVCIANKSTCNPVIQ